MVEAAARALHEHDRREYINDPPWDGLDEQERESYRIAQRIALAAALGVCEAWPLTYAAARDLIAAEIRAHADRIAPADGNLAQKRMRRHLLIAERVALGPMSREQAAEAINELYRDHTQTGGRP